MTMVAFAAAHAAAEAGDLETARDKQDRAALGRQIPALNAAAQRQANDARAQYRLALAKSYLSEVALELKDKDGARSAAESGIQAAEHAVRIDPTKAEYHRILGALCGQVIPANVLAGIKYGKCALESINKALELDPRNSAAYLSRGVGNYYLPPSFGGGTGKAVQDIEKAIELNPKSADAYLWLGIVQRKLNRNAEARQAFQKSLELNPARLWAKQQLEKTPAR